jgi:outer membrane protein, multidrug efflux system
MLPLGGCLLTSDLPHPGLDIPPAYRYGPRYPAVAEQALPSLAWWRQFRSRELTAIIEQTRAANLDIAAAIARIEQADAQVRIAGSALLPIVDLSGSGTRSQSSRNATSGFSSGSRIHDNYQGALNASYEIDFWGKNRDALRAAEETAVASRYDREVVGLSVIASAANTYFEILASQDRLRAARQNVVSATRVLNLIKQRAAAGTASDLEVSEQESTLETQQASIPPLLQTLNQDRNALALLMARSPESVRISGGTLTAIAIPRVSPGLPSQLMTQRPDIREAEANLAAANANVSNARAQFFPSITLTGEGGYQSALLKTLVEPNSAVYSIAAGLTQPIFEGGQLLGNLEYQKARQEELLQDYRKSVISGFTDVENALYNVRQTSIRVRLQIDVVRSSRRAYNISEQRLREGTIDLVTLLQTQQTLFTAEDTLAQARLARLQAIVSLYQALGGGWLPKPVDASNAR